MSYDRFPETKIIGYDHEVFNDEQAIYQELLTKTVIPTFLLSRPLMI